MGVGFLINASDHFLTSGIGRFRCSAEYSNSMLRGTEFSLWGYLAANRMIAPPNH
jgi:hypothetical protein